MKGKPARGVDVSAVRVGWGCAGRRRCTDSVSRDLHVLGSTRPSDIQEEMLSSRISESEIQGASLTWR